MKQTQFGGGLIAPQLLAHLKKTAAPAKTATKTEFGGGLISPQLTAHLKSAKVEFGAGLIHPRLARLIAG
jgi:hypothetical protein